MKGVSNDTPTETPEITDALDGGTGGLFPAETTPEIPTPSVDPVTEIPEVTIDPIADVHKEESKEKGVGTQAIMHRHNG